MRVRALLAVAACAEALVLPRDYRPAVTDPTSFEYGVITGPAPGPNKPEMQWEPAQHHQNYGAKRVKIRYGPFMIPGMMDGDLGKQMEKMGGIVWNFFNLDLKRPCDDCLLTFFQNGIEDQLGNEYNTNNGVWLHHMVAIMEGPNRWDPTCYSNRSSLPHMGVLSDARHSERFWASGNERTPADFSRSRDLAGYRLNKSDKMHFIIDLMNQNMEKKLAYLTMTFEFVPTGTPGFKNVKPVWFDADQCALSDYEVPEGKTKFDLDSSWTANFNGWIGGMAGHLHDGGVNIEVTQNSCSICNSTAKYGATEAFRSPEIKTMNATLDKFMNYDREHISSMDLCYNVGEVRVGDKFVTKADYDMDKYHGMKNDEGGFTDVMNIVIMYVVVDSEPKMPPLPAALAATEADHNAANGYTSS